MLILILLNDLKLVGLKKKVHSVKKWTSNIKFLIIIKIFDKFKINFNLCV